MTYISWFSDFALYLEYYLLDKCHTWDISSLWPDYWCQNISLLVWPIFHGSVILPYILNTICWINVPPGILVPYDPMNDHLLYLGHCNLYFMVQWFCLISYNIKCTQQASYAVLRQLLLHMWFWHGFQAHTTIAEHISCIKLKIAKTLGWKSLITHMTHVKS